ncbi:acyl-CoA synthetase [Microbacterium sp. 4R-513]|uniref:acyl-CoA synthetase n=1 Tax=Microbacterium sp. 4R-513 TaxID=2567934 RepID=UPI0013E139FE|nr:acyl-CoA synthetase [Microbacterium sp. 4R-513]QIG39013.1 acyl-CoA synthetase [Microbacterium sp. 4R-513]
MSTSPAPRTFEVRHVQLARAVFAALAAVMITFSPDHSAAVGMSVFSGWAIATSIVFFVSIWLVYPSGQRWPSVLLGIVTVIAGMAGGVTAWRTTLVFFIAVIAWALLAGTIETVAGARARRALRDSADAQARGEARDALTIGIITIVLGLGLLFVPTQYALNYYIEDAGRSFTLTGITIGVGIFGGYAAIIAVYLAIAGFSPRRASVAEDGAPAPVENAPTASDQGGAA